LVATSESSDQRATTPLRVAITTGAAAPGQVIE
jgi:hypothetical protein